MNWWACDNGHSNMVPDNTTLKVTRMKCPQCIDNVYYRIEITVPEDDPKRFVERPRMVVGFLGEDHPLPVVHDGELWPDAEEVKGDGESDTVI